MKFPSYYSCMIYRYIQIRNDNVAIYGTHNMFFFKYVLPETYGTPLLLCYFPLNFSCSCTISSRTINSVNVSLHTIAVVCVICIQTRDENMAIYGTQNMIFF